MPLKPQIRHKPGKATAHGQQLLEQELLLLWQRAANTRKSSSARRLDTILRNSRSELALRDVLMFALYLLGAFVSLFKTSLSALLNLPAPDVQPALPKNNSNEPLP